LHAALGATPNDLHKTSCYLEKLVFAWAENTKSFWEKVTHEC